jgi:hypothetical protein
MEGAPLPRSRKPRYVACTTKVNGGLSERSLPLVLLPSAFLAADNMCSRFPFSLAAVL